MKRTEPRIRPPAGPTGADERFMREALRLARQAVGQTSPNPVVGAVLVQRGKIIGRGWHHRAGLPHAEVEAILDARRRGGNPRGATLYVTLEPCSSHGRQPACTGAIEAAGIRRVVAAATDPNPEHRGRGYLLLKRAGVRVTTGLLAAEATRLNESFNHWIVYRTPFVTVKAAMTLDGRIATATGESKWITGAKARTEGLRLRRAADAVLVGINTILADDPSLTPRRGANGPPVAKPQGWRRIILDSRARTPLTARVVADEQAGSTIIVVTRAAPARRVAALARRAQVWVAPEGRGGISLPWLLTKLGRLGVTSLLVEGGGEVNASFLLQRLAHRVAFFYAPKILGGREARRGVAGEGARRLDEALALRDVEWRRVGPDLMLTARVD